MNNDGGRIIVEASTFDLRRKWLGWFPKDALLGFESCLKSLFNVTVRMCGEGQLGIVRYSVGGVDVPVCLLSDFESRHTRSGAVGSGEEDVWAQTCRRAILER